MSRYSPLTLVLLAFWLGKEIGAQDEKTAKDATFDHIKASHIKASVLVVDQIWCKKVAASDQLLVGSDQEPPRTVMTPGALIVHSGSEEYPTGMLMLTTNRLLMRANGESQLDVNLAAKKCAVTLSSLASKSQVSATASETRSALELVSPSGGRFVRLRRDATPQDDQTAPKDADPAD